MSTSDHEPPTKFFVTVDVVLLVDTDAGRGVLLVTRRFPPFQEKRALPGGFVEPDEPMAEAAARELEEETGVRIPAGDLRQLGTYGDPGRDPRGRTITTVYWTMMEDIPSVAAGSDASRAEIVLIDRIGATDLAFDHYMILNDALGVVEHR